MLFYRWDLYNPESVGISLTAIGREKKQSQNRACHNMFSPSSLASKADKKLGPEYMVSLQNFLWSGKYGFVYKKKKKLRICSFKKKTSSRLINRQVKTEWERENWCLAWT